MRIPIKNKKDWCITFLIVLVILYYLSLHYDYRIEEFMIRFSPDKMNMMNYPGGWGNFMFVGAVMTILVVLILVITKKSIKRILLCTIIGIVFTCSMFLAFLIHTDLIVDTSKTMKATSVWISGYENNINIHSSVGEEITDRLIASAVALETKPNSERSKPQPIPDTSAAVVYNIWISYPEKYGQSYDLIIYVEGNKIYSYHGGGTPDTRVYYEDNGFLQNLQDIIDMN